ncbi:hypothetical protein ACVWZ4_003257 [Bradyrhizobium sp. USDA 4472]
MVGFESRRSGSWMWTVSGLDRKVWTAGKLRNSK